MSHTRDPNKVYIFDTTNRDGEQATEGAKHGIQSKLEIAKMLAVARIDRIEAGFPFSSPDEFKAVQMIAQEVHGPMIFGLSRVPLSDKGYEEIDKTYEAIKDAEYRGIHVFTVMANPKSLQAYGLARNEVVEGAVKGVAYARKLLGSNGQVEFSFQNATRIPLESLIEDTMKMINAGADVINIPDTVGYSHPEEISAIVSALRKEFPKGIMISIHCHDDLGLAVINSLAAVKAGADIVEGCINGIGERAGNTSLEEVIMNIKTRPDLFNGRSVGTATEMLVPLSQAVRYHYGIGVPDNKAVVGDNAFRHRSGIHQDGMVKGSIYEIMDPDSVGWTGESFDLTARSGYAGIRVRLGRLGYDTSNPNLKDAIMPKFKSIADERGRINDVDLVLLMDSMNGRGKYSLVDTSISKQEGSGNYHARVILEIDGKKVSSGDIAGSGKTNGALKANGSEHYGAIDALYAAVDAITGKPKDLHLVSYDPVNIGSGSSAAAEVTVILSKSPQFDGKITPLDGMYIGRARHVDTLTASVMAYVSAINKAQGHV